MADGPVEFDKASVRRAWDHAAEAYAHGQASGRDYYRYEFLGPAHAAMCGEVEGMQVLDVGCGAGYFARQMARRGARVIGIDISPNMIEQAERHEAREPLGIEYRVGDATDIDGMFQAGSFDAATSCLALQDMPDAAQALRAVSAVLRPNGRFVASITHPCTDTPYRAWERDEAGQKRWLCLDGYFERKPIAYRWRNWAYEFTTPALHATLADWFAWIFGAGFRVCALSEPRPSEQALAKQPELADAARMPYFLIFDLVRER